MFAGDQSDVQEFFLFLMEEVSKEVASLTDAPRSEESDGEWRSERALNSLGHGHFAHLLTI